ncbi:MAG: SPASM domain-containing protein [Burkholderiales bacterium]
MLKPIRIFGPLRRAATADRALAAERPAANEAPAAEAGVRRLKVRFYTDYNICNYTCEYCIAGQNDPNDPRVLAQWHVDNYRPIIDAMTRLPYELNVRLGVGGEFFLNPQLIDGARVLSHSANVSGVNLITNLSFPVKHYRRWFGDFDRAKVGLVASYHPTQIKDKDEWWRTARAMNDEVDFSVCTVAHPTVLPELAAVIPAMRKAGLSVFVQPFLGAFEGRNYPDAYSDADRDVLRRLFYSRHDWEYLLVGKRPGLCNAGFKSIYVDMTGTVRICGMAIRGPEPVGNLLTGEPLALYDGPRPCTALDCRCDTENMNTVQFEQNYRNLGHNQHRYEYRFEELARGVPDWDEWRIAY